MLRLVSILNILNVSIFDQINQDLGLGLCSQLWITEVPNGRCFLKIVATEKKSESHLYFREKTWAKALTFAAKIYMRAFPFTYMGILTSQKVSLNRNKNPMLGKIEGRR